MLTARLAADDDALNQNIKLKADRLLPTPSQEARHTPVFCVVTCCLVFLDSRISIILVAEFFGPLVIGASRSW